MGWIKRIFGPRLSLESDAVVMNDEQKRQLAVRQLAFEICVQRVARAISKCRFRVYTGNKNTRDFWDYRLNVRPNPHQNATEFWTMFIRQLYYNDEALIVPMEATINGEKSTCLYVADSFGADNSRTLKPLEFTSVQIGDLSVRKKLTGDDCFYFKLGNEFVKRYLDDTLIMLIELMTSATSAYKRSNSIKYKLHIERLAENKDDKDKKVGEALGEKLKKFAASDGGAWLETRGTELTTLPSSSAGASTTRDIKALLDDTLEVACKAFLMPTNIVTGEVTDTSKAVQDFLTFCLDAVCELIQDTLNSGVFTRREYQTGSHIKIDTHSIQHIDVLDMAASVDKLLSCGVYSVNEVRLLLGDEPIDEPWADEHYMTKNYTDVKELDESGKEGRANEDEPITGPYAGRSETVDNG